MDFNWTKEQSEIREQAIKFAQDANRSDIIELDRNSEFPMDQWKKYADYGVLGLTVPTEYGGKGMDFMTCIALMEGLGYGSNDSGILLSVIAHIWSCVDPVIKFGSDEQKEKYLPGLCSGKIIGVHAITEPDGGSDALTNMKTKAIEQDGHYLLNGTKTFISNGDIADLVLVLCKVTNKDGIEKLSCLLIDKDTPGFTTKKIEKMGLRTCPFNTLEFKDCKIPKSNLIGDFGAGKIIFNHVMSRERAFVMATQIGVMESQLEKCVKYAKKRRQFNERIFNFQQVSSMIADMKVRLEASKLLVYKVGWLNDLGRNSFQYSSIAKLYVSESQVQNSILAMKIHGGYGYTTEGEVERQLRDSFGGIFTSGTSEIMKNIIAKLID